jgi:beta-lactamase regulating signal transducer with metallopeptidase domain
MKEVLLTSSALILALLLVRRAFQEKISRRVQYALWGLVLLRLLIPVQLPAVDFSLLSVAEPAAARVEETLAGNPIYVLPVSTQEIAVSSARPNVILPVEGRYSAVSQEDGQPAVLTRYAFTLQEALRLIWYGGIACMGLWLIVSNLRFWRMLRRNRIPLTFPDCKYPVYLMENGLVSPCLFGIFRPAVYLTPAAMESKAGLRHVLAHEETHGRHLDSLWALLRSLCLAVYWFDPLVWWAAAAAKEDCELACDEGALRRLGGEERIPYGQTLLRLIPLKKAAGHVMLTATTMTSDKRRMKARILRIAENRKMKTAALCTALAVIAVVCAVTFTGCSAEENREPSPDGPNAEQPTALKAPAKPEPEDAPARDVELWIPLSDLQPHKLEKVETLSAAPVFNSGHHGEGHHNEARHNARCTGNGTKTVGDCGIFSWTCGDMTYISSHDLRSSVFPSDYFLCFERADCVAEPFTNVLGYDGVMIDYFTWLEDEEIYCYVNDYYVFDEDGSIYLLARVYGISEQMDLDGDGTMELVGTDTALHAQIFFQQDGDIFEADIRALLRENWNCWDEDSPWTESLGLDHYGFFGWYPGHMLLSSRVVSAKADGGELQMTGYQDTTPAGPALDKCTAYLYLSALVPAMADDGTERPVYAYRELYFDGSSLVLVKPPEREMTDHLLDGVQDLSAVVDAARALAKTTFDQWREGYTTGEGNLPLTWDDYCITDIQHVYPTGPDQPGQNLMVYRVSLEFHTPTPAHVIHAAGIAAREDGWVNGFWTDVSPYLAFQLLEDGSCKQLACSIPGDCPWDSETFLANVSQLLTDNGLT